MAIECLKTRMGKESNSERAKEYANKFDVGGLYKEMLASIVLAPTIIHMESAVLFHVPMIDSKLKKEVGGTSK